MRKEIILKDEREDFVLYFRINGAWFLVCAWACGFIQGLVLMWWLMR